MNFVQGQLKIYIKKTNTFTKIVAMDFVQEQLKNFFDAVNWMLGKLKTKIRNKKFSKKVNQKVM